MKNKLALVSLGISILLVSCSGNIFKEVSAKNSEDALLEEAIKSLDRKSYDEALRILTSEISADRQNDVDILRLTSEAYAGKCGLDAAIYLNNLKNVTSQAMFRIFYQPSVGIAFSSANCVAATAKRVQVGPLGGRSQSDNVYLTILSMFRIGGNIQAAVDTSPAGGGDGTLDSSVCAMSNAQVDEVILGFGNMVENLAAVSASLVGGDALTSISNMTTTINAVCAFANTQCITTNQADITNAIRDAYKDLLNTVEYGVGAVVTAGNPIAIVTACP